MQHSQAISFLLCGNNSGNCVTAGPISGNMVDKKAPGIFIVAPPAAAVYTLSQVVAASYACADGGSGPATCVGPVANGSNIDTAMVGAKTFTVNATDNVGNPASKSVNYSVGFTFGGFYAPVDNQPAVNQVTAWPAIPVKFSLGGNKGLKIFAAGFPKSKKIECSRSVSLDDVEETVAAGKSSLSYDPSSGQYNYVWKTDRAWAGTCRELNVTLRDGTEHLAKFKFK